LIFFVLERKIESFIIPVTDAVAGEKKPRLLIGSESMTTNKFRICTLNVRSIKSNAQFEDFEENVSRVKFDVLGLAETRLPLSGCLDLNSGYVLYKSGKADGTSTHAGVGFYVSQEVNKQVESVRNISERIIQMILRVGDTKLRITQVYAPHSGYDEEVYDAFLEDLSVALRGQSKNDFLIGDFNAIIGPAEIGETCCGRRGTGVRNERGEILVNYCESSGWSIMNSFFKKRLGRKWTWRSPNGQTFNEIDYILAKNRTMVTDVSTLNVNAGSDHRIVRATLRIQACQTLPVKKRSLPPAFNNLKLKTAMWIQSQSLPSQPKYDELISAMKDTMNSVAGYPIRTPRISDRTKILMERRKQLKFGLGHEFHAVLEYMAVCKTLRWSLNEDIKNHQVVVLEKAIAQNRLKRGRQEVLNKRKQLTQVRKSDGTITSSKSETIGAIADFYEKLYQSENGEFVSTVTGQLESPILAEEIRRACSCIRGNTAPGIDSLPSIIIKHCAPMTAEKLADLLNQMFADNQFPAILTHAKTILLYKKGDPLDIGNYRPISLLSTVYKVLTRIITMRLEEAMMNKLPVEQAGFRKAFSTVDHIMSLNLLFEKCREWNLPLHVVFIDFKKAFDSIEFEAVWKALEYYSVDNCTIRMIKQLYSAGTSSVKVSTSSANFKVQKGVRQGDSLSPLLFILTLQFALEKINWNQRGYPISNKRLRYLAYADDIMLCSNTVPELQSMLNDLCLECRKIGLEINVNKTKWMSNTGDQLLLLHGEQIEKVDNFIYLGQKLTYPRDHNREIGRRIGSGWASFNRVRELLTSKKVPMKIKRKYFNMCIAPALLYGCTTWALTKKTETRLAVCQRRMERRMIGVRLIDKKPISWIRRKTGLTDIVMMFRKRKWFQASKILNRENECRWDTILLRWIPTTPRPLGRPRTRWEDDFTKRAKRINWKREALTDNWSNLFSSFTCIS